MYATEVISKVSSELISQRQLKLGVRGWVSSSWKHPSSVTIYQQLDRLGLLGCRVSVYEMRSLHQETVIQTFFKNDNP